MAWHRLLPGAALLAIWLASCGDENPTGPSQDSLLDPHIQPRVLGTYPSPGATGPFELFVPGDYFKPHFLVQFNKLIDLAEFERDWFSIEGFDRPVIVSYLPANPYPDREGGGPAGPIVASGQLTNVLALVVYDSLTNSLASYRVGKTYKVTVNSTLEDFTGNHPALPFSFSFTPEPYFRVVSAQPSDGDEGVPPGSALFVRFNSRVDAAIFPALQLTPGIPGKWVVGSGAPDSNSVSFQHMDPFPFASSHTLTISQLAQDAEGNTLRGSVSSSFAVVPFKILLSDPPDGTMGFGLTQSIRLTASGGVDTATVRRAFHADPPTSWRLTSSYYDQLTFTPDGELPLNTRCTITISTALLAWDGTPLSTEYGFSFTTDVFRVSFTEPYDGQVGSSRNLAITFYCTASIDPATVQPSFSISPAVPGTFFGFQNRGHFYPSPSFAPNTTYTVTISPALHSSSGVPLAAPYTFAFRTGG
jgi:Big-like domain-containing protein